MNPDSALQLVNENIRAMKAYHLEPEDCTIKLNQNENPCDWPRPIKEAVGRFCVERPWNRYPPFIPEALKDMLAEHVGAAKGSVIVGNGSNEMLLVLLLSLVNRDSTVVLCQPTFTVYRLLVNGLGATPVAVPLDAGLQYDVAAICQAVQGNPKSVLVLCSPNNPTGSVLDERSLRKVLAAHTGFCILDQAYVEFGGFNATPLLAEYPNLIVTRTFSKAFAGAGLRLGYLIGNPAVVDEINKIKLPYNINFFAEHVATVLLRNRQAIAHTVADIVKERGAMEEFLKTLPFDNVYPSQANFLLVRCRDKQRLFDSLKAGGILLRDVSSYPLLENCLRISIGSAQENAALKNALRAFFAGKS
jgi:histidinol-phosphate aminotransferase